MNDYGLKEAGMAYAAGIKVQPESVDVLVRGLSERLHSLAADVAALSERMHGIQGATSGSPGRKTVSVSWADDLRGSAAAANARGDSAMKELHRIRETLGL